MGRAVASVAWHRLERLLLLTAPIVRARVYQMIGIRDLSVPTMFAIAELRITRS